MSMDAAWQPPERPGAHAALKAPVVILVGHFGSGKSEIAVNLALADTAAGRVVTLVDLDVVKPYFRCREAREELDARGVRLIVPEGDRFWADLPIVVPAARGAMGGTGDGGRVIVDVGGDDLGARALGSVADMVAPELTELLFVVNTRRPFAESTSAIVAMLREIERASHLPITGLVANTHLMEETTPAIVLEGLETARQVAVATSIPVRFIAVLDRLLPVLREALGTDPVLPIERRLLPPEVSGRGRSRRPLGI